MSITLITGVPGSGKSLWSVWWLKRLSKDGRRLLVDGIRDLALDHVEIDEPWLRKWFEHCQANDVIVVDEVQRIWPPTSVSVKPGEDVEKLHVHRHMGVDFILITQHPQRLHKTVRDLVGRHVHVRKIFGLNRAVLYEWDHCHNPSSLRDAVKTFWAYPRDVFKLYTSAEIHTKQKAVVPKSLFLIPVALAVAVAGAWYGYKAVAGGFGSVRAGHAHTRPSTPGAVVGAPLGEPSSTSTDWRVVGRYAVGARAFVVLANERGALRLESSAGFTGEGLTTEGVVDGHQVASWSGGSREAGK